MKIHKQVSAQLDAEAARLAVLKIVLTKPVSVIQMGALLLVLKIKVYLAKLKAYLAGRVVLMGMCQV